MNKNRRGFERHSLSGSIRYQRKGAQEFASSVGRDISSTGIGFISGEFFPISTDLIFQVQHPKTHDFIQAVGRVVWISNERHSERFLVGASFIGPPLSI